MAEVLQKDLIRNISWEHSDSATKILSFDVIVHGKLYTIKLQGETVAQQLKELRKGSRIRGSFSYGMTDIDIWKQPNNNYRMEWHLASGTQLAITIQDKEMDKLFDFV